MISNASVKVCCTTIILPTHLPAAPDKNPMFLEKRVYQGSSGKVYPLPFTDRIAEKPADRKWKAVWIENEFLRVLVLPDRIGESSGEIRTRGCPGRVAEILLSESCINFLTIRDQANTFPR